MINLYNFDFRSLYLGLVHLCHSVTCVTFCGMCHQTIAMDGEIINLENALRAIVQKCEKFLYIKNGLDVMVDSY